ncbi:response regulator transcription factor [Panacibacter ginsenosidivorans]|uniref:Response regulator transcription factor n=1 Tax=Panacibacter ginsenosidivorans TaxID=1813871 RepID=A0A5B8V5C1_9BACT|nr:response regulator transcription factor [Panacibacter ginsenosidivorans]QEC66580.1 response regulator transcription factor [Panacibacter ginsenosidivorans]
MQKTIRYAIADDHKLFRKGIIAALEDMPALKLVLEAENGRDLLNNLNKAKPDIILLDLKMPEMDGIETTIEIRKLDTDVKIIVITMLDDEKYVIHLMEIGANGYLLKNAEPEEIKEAILTAYENGYYFNDFVNKALLRKLVHKTQLKPVFNNNIELTSRELEVLKLICQEQTANEISKLIFLSPRTVEGIRTKLLEKIGVKNTAGLVMYAVKNRIVE